MTVSGAVPAEFMQQPHQVQMDFSPNQVKQLIDMMQERRLLRSALLSVEGTGADDEDTLSMCSSIVSSLSTGGISQFVYGNVHMNCSSSGSNGVNNNNNNNSYNNHHHNHNHHHNPPHAHHCKHPKLKVTKLHKFHSSSASNLTAPISPSTNTSHHCSSVRSQAQTSASQSVLMHGQTGTTHYANHHSSNPNVPTLPPTMVAISTELAKLDDSLNAILREASQKHIQKTLTKAPVTPRGNSRTKSNAAQDLDTHKVLTPVQESEKQLSERNLLHGPNASHTQRQVSHGMTTQWGQAMTKQGLVLKDLVPSPPEENTTTTSTSTANAVAPISTKTVEQNQASIIQSAKTLLPREQASQHTTAKDTRTNNNSDNNNSSSNNNGNQINLDLTQTIENLVSSDGFQLLAAQLGLPRTAQQVLQLLQQQQQQQLQQPQPVQRQQQHLVKQEERHFADDQENEDAWEVTEDVTESEKSKDEKLNTPSYDIQWIPQGTEPTTGQDNKDQTDHEESIPSHQQQEDEEDEDIMLEIQSGMNAQELAMVYNTCLALSQSRHQQRSTASPQPADRDNWGCSASDERDDSFEASECYAALGDFSADEYSHDGDERKEKNNKESQVPHKETAPPGPLIKLDGALHTPKKRVSLLGCAVMGMSLKSFEPDYFDDDTTNSQPDFQRQPTTPKTKLQKAPPRPATTGTTKKMSVSDFHKSMPNLDTLEAWVEETVAKHGEGQEKPAASPTAPSTPSKRVSSQQRQRNPNTVCKKRSSSLNKRGEAALARHHITDGTQRSKSKLRGSESSGRHSGRSSHTLTSKGSSTTFSTDPASGGSGSFHSSINNTAEPLFDPFPDEAPKKKATSRSTAFSRGSRGSTGSVFSSAVGTDLHPFPDASSFSKKNGWNGDSIRDGSTEKDLEPFDADFLMSFHTIAADSVCSLTAKDRRRGTHNRRLGSSMPVLDCDDLSKTDHKPSKSHRRRNSVSNDMSSQSEHLGESNRRKNMKTSGGGGSRRNKPDLCGNRRRTGTRDSISVTSDEKSLPSKASRRSHSGGPAQRSQRRDNHSSLRDLFKRTGTKLEAAAAILRRAPESPSDSSVWSLSKASITERKRSSSHETHKDRARNSSNKSRGFFQQKDNRSNASPLSMESGINLSTHMKSPTGKSPKNRTSDSSVRSCSKDRTQRRRRTENEVKSDRKIRRAGSSDKREKSEGKDHQMDGSVRRSGLPNVLEHSRRRGQLPAGQAELGLMVW